MSKIRCILPTILLLHTILTKSGAAASSKCDLFQFRCKNGQCIESEQLCDGQRHCLDGSDETSSECITMQCPHYAFRCAYGACVPSSAKCNGEIDCADKSDETELMCSEDKYELLRKIQGRCSDEFTMQCKSGACIGLENACDGEKHCADGSDETVELCADMQCPSYAFRCGYGGCVSGRAMCNGFADCVDASDETLKLCAPIREGSNKTDAVPPTVWPVTTRKPVVHTPVECMIPSDDKYLVVRNYVTKEAYTLGQNVSEKTLAIFECKRRRKLEGNSFSACFDGKWIAEPPTCIIVCRGRQVSNGISTVASCTYFGKKIKCERPQRVGTKVRLSCAPYYVLPDDEAGSTELTCNDDGEWSEPKLQCTPECGVIEKTHDRQTAQPWDISIFQRALSTDFTYKCQGVILSQKIVLSAASCFVNSTFSNANDPTLYNVIEGDHRIKYDQNENLGLVVHNLSQILTPSYNDRKSGLEYKIALLVLVNYFEFSPTVKPICLDDETDSAVIEQRLFNVDLGALVIKRKLVNGAQRMYIKQIVYQKYQDGNVDLLDVTYFSRRIRKQFERYSAML